MRWPVASLVLTATVTAVLGLVTQKQIEEDKLLAKSKKVRTPLDVVTAGFSTPFEGTGLFSQILQANLPFVFGSLGLLGLLALSQEFRHVLMNQQNGEQQANQNLANEKANQDEKYNKLGSVQDIINGLREQFSLLHYMNSVFRDYNPPGEDESSIQKVISVIMLLSNAALKGGGDLTLGKILQAAQLQPEESEEAEDRSDFHPTLTSMMNALSRGVGLGRITGGPPQQYPQQNIQPLLVSLLNALPKASGSGRAIGPPQPQLDRNNFQQPLMQLLSTLATGRSFDRVAGPPQPNYQYPLGSLMGSLAGDRYDDPSQAQRSSTPFSSGPVGREYSSVVGGLYGVETPFDMLAEKSKKAIEATNKETPTKSIFSPDVPEQLRNSHATTVYHVKTDLKTTVKSGHRTINIGATPDNSASAK